MKSLVFLVLFSGLLLLGVGYMKSNQQCPPPIVEFRYIPRTFEEEQDDPTPVIAQFGRMFSEPSPWQLTQGYASGKNLKGLDNRLGFPSQRVSITSRENNAFNN